MSNVMELGMNFPNHLIKSLYCRQESLALLVRESLSALIMSLA